MPLILGHKVTNIYYLSVSLEQKPGFLWLKVFGASVMEFNRERICCPDGYWQLAVLLLAGLGYWPDISLVPYELP